MRLVDRNGIRSAQIRPEGPLNPLELACKILSPNHLKNSRKKSQKTYPPPQKKNLPFGGGGSEMNTIQQHRRGVRLV
jgi:hypothetical protein